MEPLLLKTNLLEPFKGKQNVLIKRICLLNNYYLNNVGNLSTMGSA